MNSAGIDTAIDKNNADILDKIIDEIEYQTTVILARYGITLGDREPGTLVSYTRVRNAAIRQDYHEMRQRKEKEENAYVKLSDKYFLSARTVRNIIRHQCD